MKTTKINLLLYKEDYRKIEEFFKKFRWGVFIYSFVLVLSLFVFLLFSKQLDNRINDLQAQKAALLNQIKSRSTDEAGFIYLSKKVDLIDEFLRKDVKFLPYYNFLSREFDKIGSDSASLDSFSVGNDRKTIFRTSFQNIAAMLNGLKFIESSTFLNKFDSLTLISANVVEGVSNKSIFEISFEGKFKPLE